MHSSNSTPGVANVHGRQPSQAVLTYSSIEKPAHQTWAILGNGSSMNYLHKSNTEAIRRCSDPDLFLSSKGCSSSYFFRVPIPPRAVSTYCVVGIHFFFSSFRLSGLSILITLIHSTFEYSLHEYLQLFTGKRDNDLKLWQNFQRH